jgi:hypothetical protein
VSAWLGGKLALTGDPSPYFGIDAYRRLLAENFGAGHPTHVRYYRPHLLLPVMLVLTGRWRVIFAAAATTVVLVAATSLVFGVKVWTAYVARPR